MVAVRRVLSCIVGLLLSGSLLLCLPETQKALQGVLLNVTSYDEQSTTTVAENSSHRVQNESGSNETIRRNNETSVALQPEKIRSKNNGGSISLKTILRKANTITGEKKNQKIIISGLLDGSSRGITVTADQGLPKVDFSNQSENPVSKVLRNLPPIPKKIHLTWKTRDILQSNLTFALNSVRNLIDLNPDWTVELSEDADVDSYLQDKLDADDWNLIKDRHIVEKSDLWRLLKMYHEGGYYSDIDRPNNLALAAVVTSDDIKWGGHTWESKNFAQDTMLSSPGNPLFDQAIKVNLQRRRDKNDTSSNEVMYYGPGAYFFAITSLLLGPKRAFERGKGKRDRRMQYLIEMVDMSQYAIHFDEYPNENELLLNTFDPERSKRLTEQGFPPAPKRQGEGAPFKGKWDREAVYKAFGVEHWTTAHPPSYVKKTH